MKNKLSATVAILCVLALIAVPISAVSANGDGSETGKLMLDAGNGETEWFSIAQTGTYGNIITAVLTGNGHTCNVIGTEIEIDGKKSVTIGADKTSDNILDESGTSGIKITSKWSIFKWNTADKKWETVSTTSSYSSGDVAVGFYPENTVPAETPDNQAVTCVGYDAKASGHQTAVLSTDPATVQWAEKGYNYYIGVYSQILTAGGYAFIKYGSNTDGSGTAAVVCRSLDDGSVKWSFTYKENYYETSTSLIVGDYIYIQSSEGKIYKIDWKTSTGTAVPVKTLSDIKASLPGYEVKGDDRAEGPTSLTCDSGAIYTMSSNGMVYCFDLDLNPVWSHLTGGKGYYSAPVIYDDYVYAGMLDGHLYILNKITGTLVKDIDVYSKEYHGEKIGSVGMPAIIKDDGKYYIFASFTDGLGMSSQVYGLVLYKFDGTNIDTILKEIDTFGTTGSFTSYVSNDFKGVFFEAGNKMYKMDLTGQYSILNDSVRTSHSSLVMVNESVLITTSYTKGEPVCEYDLTGKLIGIFQCDEKYYQYCMCGVTVIDGMYLYGNDSSAFIISGGFNDPTPAPIPEPGLQPWQVLLITVGVIIAILVVAYCIMRFGLKWEHPFTELSSRFKNFLYGENYSHNTLRRHRLWLVMGIGILLTLIAAMVSLCVGPTSILSPGDMFANLFSAIGKGGNNLTYDETMVYSARLPRTLVALAVGIGLSIAGAMYQAIIRNPLVDPYIMGVSSGAGTAAIAVIAFDFTFFGLFPSHSIYLTAFTAAVGGIIAFFCTMVLANKAGGSSVNYVLAGVVVGLVFSAIQTLMLTFAGTHVTGALSWLYGSFSNITWSKVWIVVIPVLAISLASLLWAKEFNLVLLGEDQAKQMGLNVKKFNRWMLIMASVLTSICVAFVGIIGFVGLVIPHLCRMMLGGDHRLVLPSSMAFGGFLMIIADIAARMLVPGFELPVGAITTIIGVPVFAWLLIKRGKMYEG